MWAAVKTRGDPIPSRDRTVEVGLQTSLPRNAEPVMLVIRTSTVSPVAAVPVRSVSLTRSPTSSPRMASRSPTSSMPTSRRLSSIFSISTRFPMLGPFARPGRGPMAAGQGRDATAPPGARGPPARATRRAATQSGAASEHFADSGRVFVQGEAAFRQHLRAYGDQVERPILLRTLDVRQIRREVLG